MKDTKIFDDKDLSGLLKDVYSHSQSRRAILTDVIDQIRKMICDLDTAVMLAPVLKEYLDVLGRNDEHLLKIATVVQRIIAAESAGGSGDVSEILSAAERQALLKAAMVDLESGLVEIESVQPARLVEKTDGK